MRKKVVLTFQSQSWNDHLEPFALANNKVCVWSVRHDPAGLRLNELRQILAPDEQERADRFHFARDRDSYTLTRSALRLIVAGCLNRDAACLNFEYGAQGKPRLTAESELCFNVSHAKGLALIAVTLGREVGVDIEYIHRRASTDRLPERFFSPREVAELRAMPEDQQRDYFFVCWTRKEAYIKARGGGLSIQLDSFDVSLSPGRPAQLLAVRQSSDQAENWRMVEIYPGESGQRKEHVAALIVEGQNWGLELRRWVWPARYIDLGNSESD